MNSMHLRKNIVNILKNDKKKMRRLSFILLITCVTINLCAQTQQGMVKTKGRLAYNGTVIHGTALSGATVIVKGLNAVVSGSNGQFSLSIPSSNYYLQSVQKQGYVLTDPDILSKQYVLSKNPLVLVLEDKEQQATERRAIIRKISNNLYTQLQKRSDELEVLREEHKITEEKFRELLQKLNSDQDNNEKIIQDMAERYARIDFDQTDEFNRRISDCIINGRLTEADSLLNTKGDIKERIERLNKLHEANVQTRSKLELSESMEQKTRDDLARDCYLKFEIFKMQHQKDSAAYYIEYRASIDTTNIDWQIEAGNMISMYAADYNKALGIFQKTLNYVLHHYGDNNQYSISIYNNIAEMHYELGDNEKAMELYQKVFEIEKELYGEDHHTVVTTLSNMGLTCNQMGKHEKAEDYYLKALACNRCESEDSALIYVNLGGLYLNMNKLQDAMRCYETADELIRDIYGDKENPLQSSCYAGMASCFKETDDFNMAIDYYKKSLDVNKALYGEEHPQVATNLNSIGSFYNEIGKYEEAQTFLFQALAINTMVYGKHHPSIATDYNNIGFSYCQLGNYDEALKYYQRALAIDKDYYGLHHVDVAIRMANIGAIYGDLKDYPKALEYITAALGIFKEIVGEKHLKTISCYNNTADIYVEMEEYDKAEEILKKVLDLSIAVYGDDHTMVSYVYNNLGKLYNQKGDLEQAAVYVEKSFPILIKAYGEKHPNVAISYYNVSVLHKKQGDYVKSLELANKAYEILREILPENHPTLKTISDGIEDVKQKMK